MGSIVVGVDESENAALALRWAVREGKLRGWSVTAALCWDFMHQHHAERGVPFDPDYWRADAREAIEKIVHRAVGEDQSVECRLVLDLPARGLLEVSADADLLVLGPRGRSSLPTVVLGSVSRQCLHHAPVPVAIVRDEKPGENRIVVGVDGSESSARALAWALDEARLRKAPLTIVHAWLPPMGGGYLPMPVTDVTITEQVARDVVAGAIATADTSGLAMPIEQHITCGSAGGALVEAADAASLVVVGSRGLGGFEGLLLGSVSHHVAHHASCPVVVIPTSH
jgi:nucleotide-binding universal stress UspA family protein